MRNVILVTAGIAGLRASVEFLKEFGRLDPFSALHPQKDPDRDTRTGILFKDVDLKHFKGVKLTSRAHVDELEVLRGRQQFDLKGIKDGQYNSEKGPLKFAAKAGHFDVGTDVLTVNQGARVAMKDFDVNTPFATIDQRNQVLKMPRTLKGRLLSGMVGAESLTLSLKPSHDILVNGVKWEGNGGFRQDADPQAPRTWTIMKMDTVRSSGDVVNYTNGEITDGDVIVHGQNIEWNRKTDVVVATGKVSYFSGEADMTSDKATVYRKEKRAVMEGHVTMLIRPKDKREDKPVMTEIAPFNPSVPDDIKASRPVATSKSDDDIRDPKTIREYPMKVRADYIEYFYKKGSRHANVSGKPEARQDLPGGRWRHVWATTAAWDGEKDELTLFSTKDVRDVRFKTWMGDDLIAKAVTVSTKEDDEAYSAVQPSGPVVGDLDEDIPRPNKGSKPGDKTPPPADKGTGTAAGGGTGGGSTSGGGTTGGGPGKS